MHIQICMFKFINTNTHIYIYLSISLSIYISIYPYIYSFYNLGDRRSIACKTLRAAAEPAKRCFSKE